MLRPAVFMVALLIASPALAEVTMTIENRSTQTVSGINSFPVDDNGEGVEDNLGGMYEDVLPGTSARFEITGNCGVTRFFVRRAVQHGDDLEIDIDTCSSRTIIFSD